MKQNRPKWNLTWCHHDTTLSRDMGCMQVSGWRQTKSVFICRTFLIHRGWNGQHIHYILKYDWERGRWFIVTHVCDYYWIHARWHDHGLFSRSGRCCDERKGSCEWSHGIFVHILHIVPVHNLLWEMTWRQNNPLAMPLAALFVYVSHLFLWCARKYMELWNTSCSIWLRRLRDDISYRILWFKKNAFR